MTERQLLELLLQKVTNIETEQQAMKADQHTIKTDVSNLKDGQLCLETRLETEVIDKVRALFDAREVQNDINERIISTIDRIEATNGDCAYTEDKVKPEK